MGIKHTYQSATANDGGKEVSSTRWNEDHQIDGPVLFPNSADPVTPSADTAYFYFKNIAGKMQPKVMGPSGLDFPLQAAFWSNNIAMWSPTTATAGFWYGTAGSSSGTYTTALRTGNLTLQGMKRGRWANVVTTTNQALGVRGTENIFYRGNQPNQGGFFFYARAGFDVWTNGGRFFAGLGSGSTAEVTGALALASNALGFCIESGDNGAISFVTVSSIGNTYKESTGLTASSGKGYDLYFFCPPSGTTVYWRIKDLDTGSDVSGTMTQSEATAASSDLPGATTGLAPKVLASNAALTTVTAVQLSVNRIYVESDY